MATNPIPAGFHTVTPYVVLSGAARLIEFLREGLGAGVEHITQGPDGLVMHATVRIGDSMVMLCDARKDWPPRPTGFYLYVPNVDDLYKQALRAGAEPVNEPRNEFYGDRIAGVKDFAGNYWWIATHVEDVSEEEMTRRRDALFAKRASGSGEGH